MEGKEIAVWVHSNLDKVELFLNGQSLGMKEMKKDSHLAWDVTYAPGTIEARGYKGDKAGDDGEARNHRRRRRRWPLRQTAAKSPPMAKTWPCSPLKSAMPRAALCLSPITCHVQGLRCGKADRRRQWRSHRSGIRQGHFAQGIQRALHGDRAVHKTAGSITVEATSPGLHAASATIAAKGVRFARKWPPGTRSSGGFRDHWPVETSTGSDDGSGLVALLAEQATRVLFAAGWRQPYRNCGG